MNATPAFVEIVDIEIVDTLGYVHILPEVDDLML